jgi:hypothetical protein
MAKIVNSVKRRNLRPGSRSYVEAGESASSGTRTTLQVFESECLMEHL